MENGRVGLLRQGIGDLAIAKKKGSGGGSGRKKKN